MKMKKFLAIALSLCLLLSLCPVGITAAEADKVEVTNLPIQELDGNDYDIDLTLDGLTDENVGQILDADENVKVIILMDEASVMQTDANAEANEQTAEMVAQLEAAQAEVIAEIEQTVLDGAKLDVNDSYTWLLNGISAEVPYGTLAAIQAVEGVKQVLLQRSYQVCETETTAADVMTNNDGVMIGRESAWAEGYSGEGMTIAIVDTGLDVDHQNFQALDESIETAVDAEDVGAVLGLLHASDRYGAELTAEDVYYNSKVVYGFNYCDNTLDITHDNDGEGDHGTHVAGIAAANKVEESAAVGVAPDAQLMVMKVFGQNGGAYDSDILAALEDAQILGADVINLSLGSAAGFTTSAYPGMDEVYADMAEYGVVLTISAGNNYDSGYSNSWGYNASLTSNPDNAVVGSPGTYANALSVASVENVSYLANYIDANGTRIGYTDSGADYGHASLVSLTGDYQLAAVPNTGAAEDYEGLDVTGKVALVQRGSLSFSEKCANAEAAGAIACIVYNNTSGIFGMDLTVSEGGAASAIPCVSITMANGSYLLSALEEDAAMTVSFPAEEGEIANEDAYNISDFSSWGPAPDLSLEPDITAPGGNIYSTLMNGTYGVQSGTSMAAPNLAGMSALVMEYVRENFDEDSVDYRTLVRDLLMSTSTPLVDSTGMTFSPRRQGSGLANVYNSVTTKAYLTVDGADTAKVELGDDDGRIGAYDYAFHVTNFGETALFYGLSTTAQTEDVMVDAYGNTFMSGTPVALDAETANTSDALVLTYDVNGDAKTSSNDAYWIYQTTQGNPMDESWTDVSFRYDADCSEGVDTADVQAYLDALVDNESEADLTDTVLMVEAGETVDVSVNVTLSADDKAYLDTYYTNGGYVEGYTFLTAKNSGSVDLSLPYLGFYGDWAAAPVLDEEVYYWDYYYEGAMGNQYFHTLLTSMGADGYWYPGINAYVEDDSFNPSHISLSPEGNGYYDDIADIYVSMLRNAAEMTLSYTDANTGEVYFENTVSNVSKSCWANGQMVPSVYSWYIFEASEMYDFSGLENNTELVMTIEVTGAAEGDEPESFSIPITIDLEAPQLLNAEKLVDLETGEKTLKLTFTENVGTACLALLSGDGSEFFAMEGVADVEEDENGYQTYTLSYDVTNIDEKVMLVLADYALNESYYGLNLNGEGNSYGDLVAYQYNFSTGYSNWVSFDTDVEFDESELFVTDNGIVCAEYVGGFVFAQTEDGKLYGFPYADMLSDSLVLEDTYITTLNNVYQDLAYSYKEGKLYGLFTYEDDGYPTTEIDSINLRGEYYDSNLWMTVKPYQEDWVLNRGGLYGLAMAIDDDGTVYVLGPNYDWDTEGLTETAHLWSVGVEYDQWSDSYMLGWMLSEIGDTGLSMDYLQSMAWDHNSEKLYWARFDVPGLKLVSELYEINPETAEAAKLGDLSGETCALFAPLSKSAAAAEEHSNVPEMDSSVVATPILRDDNVTMNVGGTKTLLVDFDPWYSAHTNVVWSTSDETVVTVDDGGTITAVSAGSAVITVANAEDETKSDTVSVEVTALDLKLEGVISGQGAGVGSTTGVGTYTFEMVDGISSMKDGVDITAPAEMNYGLSLATSALGRGSIWASEYGNTGMIYEINSETGEVKDVLQPMDGDMLFGLSYSKSQDTFAGIMNMYLYVDLELTHEEEAEMLKSYDESVHAFTYHKINMLDYLKESNDGFVTGETGQGASSEIVFCGITTLEDSFEYEDTYKDYTGSWASYELGNYTADQTLVLLDNVGRLWYIDEVTNMIKTSDDWGNVFYTSVDGSTSLMGGRNGVFDVETGTTEDGAVICSVFNIRKIDETPLTDMFRDGTMPRITYHFSDIELAGYTADGAPMFALSLYDYWNDGITNELYLYVPGVGTGEWVMDYETWTSYEIMTPSRFYSLGNTGDYNIIATIHSATVTGGVDPEEPADGAEQTTAVNKLAAGVYVG